MHKTRVEKLRENLFLRCLAEKMKAKDCSAYARTAIVTLTETALNSVCASRLTFIGNRRAKSGAQMQCPGLKVALEKSLCMVVFGPVTSCATNPHSDSLFADINLTTAACQLEKIG